MDWLDLLAVQSILMSSPTPQFKGINSSALKLFYGSTLTGLVVKPYMTTRKTIALTRWTFVGKVMTLFLIHCLGLS